MEDLLHLTAADSAHGLTILLDAALKGLAVLVVAAGATVVLRRRSAALRHLVWTLSVLGLLAIPVLSVTLPAWRVPLLPSWAGLPVAESTASPAPATRTATPAASPEAMLPAAPRMEMPTIASLPPDEPTLAPILSPETPPVPAAAMATATASSPSPNWPAWVLLGWAAGLLVMVIPLLIGTVGIWLARRRAMAVTDPEWLSLLERLQRQLGVERPVVLLRSSQSIIPLTFGLLRPVILLPAEADAWNADGRTMVLLHELAHIRRGDCLTQLVARLARVLYWFNPLVWVAGRMLRIERERACDDLVLSSGQKAPDYAAHLLEIVRSLHSVRCPGLAAVAMARKSQFEGRLLAILDPRRNRRGLTRLGIVVATALVAAVAIPLACLKAPPPAFTGATIELRMDLDSGKDVAAPQPVAVLNIADQKELDELLAFFPDMDSKPLMSRAAGWMAGAVVELRKADGSKVTIRVSSNDDLQVYSSSSGKGDKEVRGDLKAFLQALRQKRDAAWGEAVEGVQMSVRPVRDALATGEGAEFDISFRNTGKADTTLNMGLMLGNGQTFASAVGLVLTDAMGTTRILESNGPGRIAGRVDDYLVLLKAGEVWTLRARLGDYWCRATKEFEIKLVEGLYKVSATYVGKDRQHINSGDKGPPAAKIWIGQLSSNTVSFSVTGHEPAWGEAVEGVQMRLRAEKVQWQTGEAPTFNVTTGVKEGAGLWFLNPVGNHCRLEIDDQHYRRSEPVIWEGPAFSINPGPFDFKLVNDWRTVDDNRPLKLLPGKHTARFGWETVKKSDALGEMPGDAPVLMVWSNPVEIEILPAEAKPGADVDNQQAAKDFGTSALAPINTGYFFHEGKYIDAPYVVERRGLDIYVNGLRVSRGPTWPQPQPEPPPKEDPGPPPAGAEFGNPFWQAKWRWLSTQHDFTKAVERMAEAYRQSGAFSEATVTMYADLARIKLIRKKDGSEVGIMYSAPKPPDPSDLRTMSKENLLARAEENKDFVARRFGPGKVWLFDPRGGEVVMSGDDAQRFLDAVANRATAEERQKALKALPLARKLGVVDSDMDPGSGQLQLRLRGQWTGEVEQHPKAGGDGSAVPAAEHREDAAEPSAGEVRLPFPEAEKEREDPAVRRLLDQAAGFATEAGHGARKELAAMGRDSVPAILVGLKKVANRDHRILDPRQHQDFDWSLRTALWALDVIGDRRALPAIAALVPYEISKARRATEALELLLAQGSPDELRADAKSDVPVIAQRAQYLLDHPDELKRRRDRLTSMREQTSRTFTPTTPTTPLLPGHTTGVAAAAPRTMLQAINERIPADQDKLLALIEAPPAANPENLDFLAILKLREIGDAKAVPVLEKVLVRELKTTRIHGFAAAQALFSIGTREAHDILEKHLLTPDYPVDHGIRYAFYWEMEPQKRDAFLERYHLKSLSDDLAVTLEARDEKADDGSPQIHFTLRVGNVSKRVLRVFLPPSRQDGAILLHSADGRIAPRVEAGFREDGLLPADKVSARLAPGEAASFSFVARVRWEPAGGLWKSRLPEGGVVLDSHGLLHLVEKPGKFTVRHLLACPPLTESQTKALRNQGIDPAEVWSGRVLSAPLEIDIPAVRPVEAKAAMPPPAGRDGDKATAEQAATQRQAAEEKAQQAADENARRAAEAAARQEELRKLQAATGDAAEPAAEPAGDAAERARVAALMKERAARERPLKAEWPRGDVEALRKMKPEEIVKMQIFATEYPKSGVDAQRTHTKRPLEISFGGEAEDRGAVTAVLALLAKGQPHKPSAMGELLREDRVLVVQPVEGEPIEFVYSSDLDAPFAGLDSRELKEALYALSGGRSNVTVTRMSGGQVQETLHEGLIAPHTGGVASQRMACELHLTPEKGLTLAIKIRQGDEVLMQDEQPMHYGEAKTFVSKGPDTWVVLLHRP